MSEPTYPTRPPFFSHKFTRLLFRSCVGAQIGPDATLLLIAVAHCEDARHYSGPVKFFASNLADQIGLSVSSMERARARAVEAGWLVYIPGAKRRAARYFVAVPDAESAKPDGPLDEDDSDIPRQPDGASGEHLTEQAVSKRGESDGASGEQANHPLPSSLFPLPLPEEGTNRNGSLPAADPKKPRKAKTPKADGFTAPIPPELDTPAFREVWADWIAERSSRRNPLTVIAAGRQFKKLIPLGPETAARCVLKSITSGWSDVFPDKFAPSDQPHTGTHRPGYVLPGQPQRHEIAPDVLPYCNPPGAPILPLVKGERS